MGCSHVCTLWGIKYKHTCEHPIFYSVGETGETGARTGETGEDHVDVYGDCGDSKRQVESGETGETGEDHGGVWKQLETVETG